MSNFSHSIGAGIDISFVDAGIPQLKAPQNTAPKSVDLKHRPHASGRNSSTIAKTFGISCIAPVQDGPTNLRFVSGGYDKLIQLWTVEHDGSTPRSTKLPLFHNSFVQALAYRAVDRCLMSSAGVNIYRMDLQHSHRQKMSRLSNPIHHIHVHPQEPDITILEVCSLSPSKCD